MRPSSFASLLQVTSAQSHPSLLPCALLFCELTQSVCGPFFIIPSCLPIHERRPSIRSALPSHALLPGERPFSCPQPPPYRLALSTCSPLLHSLLLFAKQNRHPGSRARQHPFSCAFCCLRQCPALCLCVSISLYDCAVSNSCTAAALFLGQRLGWLYH